MFINLGFIINTIFRIIRATITEMCMPLLIIDTCAALTRMKVNPYFIEMKKERALMLRAKENVIIMKKEKETDRFTMCTEMTDRLNNNTRKRSIKIETTITAELTLLL